MSKQGSVIVHGDVTGSIIVTGKSNTIRVGGKRKHVSCPDRSVVVGGAVKGSVIITGNGNKVR